MTEFGVREFVRQKLAEWDEPDVHVIARRLLPLIPDDARDWLVCHALDVLVREQVRKTRSHSATESRLDSKSVSRWERHAPELMERYSVAGEWKLLGDCTVADCDWLAADYLKRAQENETIATRFRSLAALMRKRKAATVADLELDESQQLGVAA